METIKSVLNAIENAHGLPNGCYVDPALMARENQRIFVEGWAAIGFASDVPEMGCVAPLWFLNMPLLLVRSKQDEVHVFENVCRHRGMILVQEATKLSGAITCPYHAWGYDLEGELKATPHVGGPGQHHHPSVKCENLSLNKVRSAVWRDVVYVNLSGTAVAFEDYVHGLHQRWAEFDKPLYFGGGDSEFELRVQCNWKLAVENYCEAYHLPFVHPALNSYSRLEDHYNILDEASYAGQGSYVYAPILDEAGKSFPTFSGLSEKWDKAAEYCALFPNVLYGVNKDHSYAILLMPEGAAGQDTLERVKIYYADEKALSKEYAGLRAKNTSMWKSIFEEDIDVVEGMQKGRLAPRYDGGKFSPEMDNSTHHFHKWVAQHLVD